MFLIPDLSRLSVSAGEKRDLPDELVTPSNEGPIRRQRSQTPDIVKKFIRDAKQIDDRKSLVELISSHLRDATVSCRPPLTVTLVEYPDAEKAYSSGFIECKDGGEIERFVPWRADDYLVLRTEDECDLSVMGLSYWYAQTIEMLSNTPPGQRQKGYNSLMRAIAVLIACTEEESIVSIISNEVSAYALLTRYETVVEWNTSRTRSGTTTYSYPMSKANARMIMNDVATITIKPSDSNFEHAARIIMQGDVLCANHKPR